MRTKRIIGIVLVLLGMVSLYISNYITTQVEEGKPKVARGQKSVDNANKLFSTNPYTKEVGKGFTGSAQHKINKGKQEIRDYEAIAERFYVGGIITIIVGVGVFAISFIGNKKKRR